MSHRLLLLILLYFAAVLFLQFRPSHDADLFWQVKTGQLVIQQGELIGSDRFSSTHAGEPVPAIGWLSQVCFAALHAAGSWRLLHQVNVLVFAGAFFVATLTVRRRDTSVFANLLGMSLGLLVALPHCEIRPHSFAILGFALILWLSQSEIRAWGKLVAACVILVIWQNMHPSVLLAAAVLGAQAAAGWLRVFFDREAAKPWTATAITVLAGAATMATPMGTHIFANSAYNTEISCRLGITEWLPLWHPATRASGSGLVWLALGVSLVLLLRIRRQVRLEEVATLLVLAAAALFFYRLSLFLAVAMVPVWSRWIHQAWTHLEKAPVEGDSPIFAARKLGQSPGWAAVSIAVMAAVCALGLPRLLDTEVLDGRLPLAAAERLRKSGVRGTIYNYREWSGPLIWAGYPDWKVTIDGRLYLYSAEDWQHYHEIALGRVPVELVDARYRPAAFFLRPSYHRRFIELLRRSERWKEAYADKSAIVFLRR